MPPPQPAAPPSPQPPAGSSAGSSGRAATPYSAQAPAPPAALASKLQQYHHKAPQHRPGEARMDHLGGAGGGLVADGDEGMAEVRVARAMCAC